ncbi:GntR family transcriptional regulator, partial [bacterium]|nr:GntR family transcriptional regulator [bacterium]
MQNDIFKKVKTQKKSTVVVDQIVHLIREKKLKEGDRLPAERYLSETLGVSRGVLREAIRALEIAGVINAVSGSGNYISLNEDGFSKEYDALKILSSEDNPLDII